MNLLVTYEQTPPKSNLTAIPFYLVNGIKIPNNISKVIVSLNKSFFWNNNLEDYCHRCPTPLILVDKYVDLNVKAVWYKENTRRKSRPVWQNSIN